MLEITRSLTKKIAESKQNIVIAPIVGLVVGLFVGGLPLFVAQDDPCHYSVNPLYFSLTVIFSFLIPMCVFSFIEFKKMKKIKARLLFWQDLENADAQDRPAEFDELVRKSVAKINLETALKYANERIGELEVEIEKMANIK